MNPIDPARHHPHSRFRERVAFGAGLATLAAALSVLAILGHRSSGPPANVTHAQAVQALADSYPNFAAETQARAPRLYLPGQARTTVRADMDALADCMGAHGVPAFPRPDANFGDGTEAAPVLGGPEGGDLNSATPSFAQAMSACQDEATRTRSDMLDAMTHGGTLAR